MRGIGEIIVTTKLLKAFLCSLVFGCVSLSVIVPSVLEQSGSVFVKYNSYDAVPYLDGIDEDNVIASTIDSGIAIDTYYGTITAYGPDCVGCSGITASGYKVAEKVGGVITATTTTYTDETYGELRILASANSFPFGTVMRITGDRIDGSIMGIVLDRGGAMNNAWGDGEVLIDLLFATEHSNEVYEFGRQKNVKFEVLRYGR